MQISFINSSVYKFYNNKLNVRCYIKLVKFLDLIIGFINHLFNANQIWNFYNFEESDTIEGHKSL